MQSAGPLDTAAARAFAKVLIVNDAGEILCLRRSMFDAVRPGGWDFPGGTLEPGEGFTEAVIRETMEESGLRLQAPFIAFSKSERRDWGTGVWVYYVEYVSGRPDVVLSDEHEHYEWMLPEAFRTATEYPKHHQIIDFLQEHDLFAADHAGAVMVTARSVIVNDEGAVLMLRRSATDPFYAGAWDLPGGRAEPNEEPHETAIRETLEETGLRLAQAYPLFATSAPRREGSGTWIFFGGTVTGDVVLSFEHDAYRWVPFAEVSSLTDYPVLTNAIDFIRP